MSLSKANNKPEKRSLTPLFSTGQELANLAVSSGLLAESCEKISQLYSQINHDEPIGYIVEKSNYFIIVFGTSPFRTEQLVKKQELVPSTSLPLLQFLCSDRCPSFSIHRSAVTLFPSPNRLSDLQTKIENFEGRFKGRTRIIITGHSLGGSVASLFTLWLLDSIYKKDNERKDKQKSAVINHTLCVTFGAPLVGDKGFQEAISCCSLWNSCFLHVVAREDLVPKLFISPHNPNAINIDNQTGAYMPFGTFLLCSAFGCTCVEDPDAVSKLLEAVTLERTGIQNPNKAWQISDYENLVKDLMSYVPIKRLSQVVEFNMDTLQAGIRLQLEAIGVTSIQNSGDRELVAEMERREKDCLLKKKIAYDPSKELNDIKLHMAKLEWYKKTCASASNKLGYYDSYKRRGSSRRDMDVVTFKKHLDKYWEKMVAEAEKIPQTEEAAFKTGWLYGGTNYRRMVEPLAIADYYRDGGRDYKTHGRPQHFMRLEKWLEEAKKLEAKKQNVSTSSTDSKKQNASALLTEDSCFWADVEEALIQCNSVKKGEQSEAARENLIKFEEDVMKKIENYAVSPEIFLEWSSFRRWWREYEEIMGPSHSSQLTHFMKNGHYNQYGNGS
ncbi:senescence-associated carboxylesterase 101 isoform X2 [Mangifera indica]|uniref:senescence-associated carboxylesterase 101 isoform X2 n=1 Tax=Mangifera indica TaxID=29780 RepID=UPI001CF964D3|nr:senescence-associated carboxylesterase 101 isoform X2 [Mangifera indica]